MNLLGDTNVGPSVHKVLLYHEATKGAGRTDMNQCDISVDLEVGRIRVFVIFSVVSRLLVS